MTNPWSDIPEADYVGHMSGRAVNQWAALNRLFHEALAITRPHAVLVLGCSTGNGLEHVESAVTSRVTVVDVNANYLRRLVERFPSPGFVLDARCTDVADEAFEREAFDLIHAALLLEYVEWRLLLPRVAHALRPGGALSVVLQLPSASSPPVTPTEFTSLRALESLFRFVDPEDLVARAHDVGIALAFRGSEPVGSEKTLEVLRFVKSGTP